MDIQESANWSHECVVCSSPDNERATMNVPELATVLGVSRGKAYELASSDSLPVRVIRLGKRMVVSRAEVHKLIHG